MPLPTSWSTRRRAFEPARTSGQAILWLLLAMLISAGACKAPTRDAPAAPTEAIGSTGGATSAPGAALSSISAPQVEGTASRASPRAPAPDPSLPDATSPEAYVLAVDARPLQKRTTEAECLGGEKKVTWHGYTDGKELLKAELSFAAAGHRSWRYSFYYRAAEPVAIRHRVSTWAFEGGNANQPTTRDTILERRYALQAAKGERCVRASAQGTGTEIEKLLAAAPETATDCSDVKRLLTLATHAGSPERDAKWLTVLCSAPDPSSGMKLR